MDDENYMRMAIDIARTGIKNGQTPFGAAVVQNGKLVSANHNTVWRDCDPSAHAEVNAIRAAAKLLKRIEFSGCTLYTTCEPCPMCLSAIHWAKFDRVVYGATIADAADAGFDELFVPATEMVRMGRSPLRVENGVLQQECSTLFSLWKQTGLSQTY